MDAFFTSYGLRALITLTFLELPEVQQGAKVRKTGIRRARKISRMTGAASVRIIAWILLGTCAVCQHLDNKENSLPNAPNAQTLNRTEMVRSFIDAAGQPITKRALASGVFDLRLAPKYDPLHFDSETISGQQSATDPNSWMPSLLKRNTGFHTSSSTSLVGRATDAALSVIVTRDECGQRKLNTPYLLRVLTLATAHVAQRPYWHRSVGQPFSDFGSTIGNDAGMNLLHEFQPGLMELVKSHEPKFVSSVFTRSGSRTASRPGRSSSRPSLSEVRK